MTGIHQALTGSTPTVASLKLIDIITGTIGTSSLNFCFDAGDSNSYSSGQLWNDVSGNGFSVNLGTTTSVEATLDPVFVGTPGSLGEVNYWTGDGVNNLGFTWSGSVPTFQNPWPKSGGTCTLLVLAKWSASDWTFLDTTQPVGVQLRINGSTSTLRTLYSLTDTPTTTNTATSATVSTTGVNFLASSFVANGSASSTHQVNSVQESWTSSATTVTGNSSAIPTFSPATVNGFNNTTKRLYGVVAWSRALSTTELNLIYGYCKQRFSSMP